MAEKDNVIPFEDPELRRFKKAIREGHSVSEAMDISVKKCPKCSKGKHSGRC